MFDVDHFKQYDDHYGRGAGDEALRRVADVLLYRAKSAGRNRILTDAVSMPAPVAALFKTPWRR